MLIKYLQHYYTLGSWKKYAICFPVIVSLKIYWASNYDYSEENEYSI